MIYESLGLPRVEFAAADVRDNDYDAYVPTYLTLTYPSYLPTHLSIFGSSLLFASSTYDGTTLFFALSLSPFFYLSFSLSRSSPALTAAPRRFGARLPSG